MILHLKFFVSRRLTRIRKRELEESAEIGANALLKERRLVGHAFLPTQLLLLHSGNPASVAKLWVENT